MARYRCLAEGAGPANPLGAGYTLNSVVCYDATTCVAFGGYKPPGIPRTFPTQPIRVVITKGVIGGHEDVPYACSRAPDLS